MTSEEYEYTHFEQEVFKTWIELQQKFNSLSENNQKKFAQQYIVPFVGAGGVQGFFNELNNILSKGTR